MANKPSQINRRTFMNYAATTSIGVALSEPGLASEKKSWAKDVSIGIIGMDTSHSPAFTKYINDRDNGFKVVAAYTTVSKDIPASNDRVEGFTKELKDLGIEIVDSIKDLLKKVDCVLLETNDGRLHLEQAQEVFESGKLVFMDKPVAASLKDVLLIYDAAEKHNVKTFSTSGTRYMSQPQLVRNGSIGEVLGANTYSPIKYDPHHSDLFWYGIHGVELLFTVLGKGCQRVRRVRSGKYDYVIGEWDNGRIGTSCGIIDGKQGYGGQAFGANDLVDLGKWEGYDPMIEKILEYFRTGEVPVDPNETIEVYAFMDAARISNERNEASVTLEEALSEARN